MAHKSHFKPLYKPKFRLGEVEKAFFQVVARHLVQIYILMTSPKCYLGEVGIAMIQRLVVF